MSTEDRDGPESLPIVRLKHHTYQASKAELDAPIILPGNPTAEELARALLKPAKIVHEEPS